MDLSLITNSEGFRTRAYKDQNNVMTIGYGTTFLSSKDRKVQEGDTITKEEALQELNNHVNKYILPKLQELGPLPDKLSESLCSLAYNVGATCLGSVKLKQALEQKNKDRLSEYFMQYRFIGRIESAGLINRRKREIENWRGKIWQD